MKLKNWAMDNAESIPDDTDKMPYNDSLTDDKSFQTPAGSGEITPAVNANASGNYVPNS